MARLRHGESVTFAELGQARSELGDRSADVPVAFAAAVPTDPQDFDFLFPELQQDPDKLLPESRQTRDNLVLLGRAMHDPSTDGGCGDSRIPAAYTYFGQFVDHDVTLETVSATLPQLLDPNLTPLPLAEIQGTIRNARTATLDLDSVYGLPAPQAGGKLTIGPVTPERAGGYRAIPAHARWRARAQRHASRAAMGTFGTGTEPCRCMRPGPRP